MAWIHHTGRTKVLVYAILYLLAIPALAILNPLTQYRFNYGRYGSPVPIPWQRQAVPFFFEQTFVPFAGILSIQDGFLTFKFFDLIQNPVTDLQEEINASSHRTSLWTRLYGSAHSIHFENYPPTWRTPSQKILTISRLIYLLALVPTTLMLIGAVTEIQQTLKGILTRNPSILQGTFFGLITLVFVGHLIFIALYAFEYRTYTFMKAIFIYPGLLALPALFLRGFEVIASSPKLGRWSSVALGLSVPCLVFLYILDVAHLIFQLLPN